MAGQSASFRLQTDAFPERDRVEIMREIYGRTVLKVDVDALSPLDVDMTVRSLPGLGIATGNCSQLRAHHSTTLIDNDDIILLVALSGASLMKHRGSEAVVDSRQALMMNGEEVGVSQLQPGGLRFINMSFSTRRLQPLVGNPFGHFHAPASHRQRRNAAADRLCSGHTGPGVRGTAGCVASGGDAYFRPGGRRDGRHP